MDETFASTFIFTGNDGRERHRGGGGIQIFNAARRGSGQKTENH